MRKCCPINTRVKRSNEDKTGVNVVSNSNKQYPDPEHGVDVTMETLIRGLGEKRFVNTFSAFLDKMQLNKIS